MANIIKIARYICIVGLVSLVLTGCGGGNQDKKSNVGSSHQTSTSQALKTSSSSYGSIKNISSDSSISTSVIANTSAASAASPINASSMSTAQEESNSFSTSSSSRTINLSSSSSFLLESSSSVQFSSAAISSFALSSQPSSSTSSVASLIRIVVSVDRVLLHVGDVAQITVEEFYTDGSSKPVTDAVWDGDGVDNQIAAIDASGKLTAKAVGHVMISTKKSGVVSNIVDVTIDPASITFHLLKTAGWTDNLKAHWWSDQKTVSAASTFPGASMRDTNGDGWYDITISDVKETNILFNDGGAANAGFHQTTDQYARSGGWFVPDEFPNKNGKYYGTWYDIEPVLAKQEICDVKLLGAIGDGHTDNTKVIQKAIDNCASKNGIVRLHDGKFLTGMLELKSNVTLRIEPSATLLGSKDINKYPKLPELSRGERNDQYHNCRKALIYSAKAKNIRIDGGGTIDADGNAWGGDEDTRPMAIFLVQTDGITLQNITIKNSGMWTLVPFESTDIVIRGVTVQSLASPTRDGIDPVDSHHVLIEDVDVTSQDDAICLKSGSSFGVEDVIVRHSRVHKSSAANGLKLGTATKGPFKNILFDTISLEDVRRSGMAVESVNGSAVSDIYFRNIVMKDIGIPFYIVLGDRTDKPTITPTVGSINNITYENIVATDMKQEYGSMGSFMSGVKLLGKTYYLTNLTFKNIDLTFNGGSTNFAPQPEYNEGFKGEYPDAGDASYRHNNMSEPFKKKDMPGYLFFRHVNNLSLINVDVKVSPKDQRPLILKEDVH